MLDGVYRNTEGELVFDEASAPSRDELAGLLDKIIARLLKLLTRLGHLVEEQDIANIDPDNALTPLQAASCTYRIAASAALTSALIRFQVGSRQIVVHLR